MEEYIKQLLARKEAEKLQMKKMLSDTQYISWLVDFTDRYPNFSDNDWLYNPSEISDYDTQQVNNLSLLFDIIDNYANRNYIYPITIPLRFAEFYKIRYGNIGFEIGELHGQGTIIWCNRLEIDNENEFINFMDIMSNKKGVNVNFIKEKLDLLSNMIISLYDNGIPISAIMDTLNKTVESIKIKDKNKQEEEIKKRKSKKI